MKYIKYSFLLVAAAATFSSCDKELNQNNPQAISEANAFQTIEHVQLGVNGAFGRYGTYSSDMYKSALVTDEVKIGPDNGGAGGLTYRYQYGSDGTSGGDVIAGYYGYYSLIDQINRVLPYVFTVTGGTEARKNELKGHLLGLRAIAHFGLLQSFCKNYDPAGLGVAIMTVSNPLAKPARNTMGEVMAQIEADLAEAKTLVPAITPANFTDTVMNKVNITAYQARIALYKGDYTAAVNHATEVINSNVRPLVSGFQYAAIWTDDVYDEVLFRIRFLNSTAIGGLWTNTGGSVFLSPSDKLVSSYAADDIRRSSFIGVSPAGKVYVNKFYQSSRGARMVDIKACRTAEMYLIRAEANVKKSSPDLTAAAADLNFLRSQRIASHVDETFSTADALLTAIIQERYKELCFEGFRLYDLKRNNLPVQRNASDASPEWQSLAAGSFRFVMPIPRDAINANPNTVQNEGY